MRTIAFFAMSCASCVTATYNRSAWHGSNDGLLYRCLSEESFNEAKFMLEKCFLANQSDQWLSVKIVRAGIADVNHQSGHISTPDEILRVIAAERDQRRENSERTEVMATILGSLAVGAGAGLAHAVFNGGHDLGSNSSAVVGGTVGAAAASRRKGAFRIPEQSELVSSGAYGPKHVLYGEDLKIPPKMMETRYIMVELRNDFSKPQKPSLCFERPNVTCADVDLRDCLQKSDSECADR